MKKSNNIKEIVENTNENTHVKNTFSIVVLIAIIVSVSTYAWYIAMRNVYVTSFDIEVSSTDGLLLSLDGKDWDTTVFINEDNYNSPYNVYEGNTNSWVKKGLKPLSTVGDLDPATSRMKLFEKQSYTASAGGYRLTSTKVDNRFESPDGYVVFDMFVKNFSSRQYLKELDLLYEEAVYLTSDSEVISTLSGGEKDKSGIENSVRVAFAQLGRVVGTTINLDIITGINCSSTEYVTGICRKAVIWEPNDLAHNNNAIKWYETSCKTRTGSTVMSVASYRGKCNKVENGKYYPTYGVNSEIKSVHNVDIYDGEAYNSYTKTQHLSKINSFTDSMKNGDGFNRQEIYTLAPNSITKIRVYIYLEGQDIDNYDFAQIGRRIETGFGFTKERFYTPDDEFYDGPEYERDIWKPVLTLEPDVREMSIKQGEVLILPFATATDKYDEVDGVDLIEDLTRRVIVHNPVNNNRPGLYFVTYDVSDWAGNYAEPITLEVTVEED